ncbi:hypothetical protein CK203_047493 [Vitis vinifera]|uniref:Uncharacterized protein n=1 Tax=Vitis vinifera TaxID=29760 RepID=A0A438H6L7_VITVI|nr:hypothetical protein CK203_047493 [Vitis vinifera]
MKFLLLGHTQLLSHISLFSVVQYISLLFIGMLIVISVRGFLSNLMKQLNLHLLAVCSSSLQFPELGVDLQAMLYFFSLKSWECISCHPYYDKEKLSN